MKSKILFSTALVFMLGCGTNAYADLEDVVVKLGERAIDATVEIATSDSTSATLTATDIKNTTTMRNGSLSVGNSGVNFTADEVEAMGTTITNTTTMDGSKSFGNSGINVGDASQAGGLIK